jgi:hypothetical protein
MFHVKHSVRFAVAREVRDVERGDNLRSLVEWEAASREHLPAEVRHGERDDGPSRC